MRQDIPKKKKKTEKQNLRNTDTWRLNNMFLNNQVTEEIKTEIFLKSRNKQQ